MSSEDTPPAGDAWIPFLISKGRFLEVMVIAWQTVEDLVDQMTMQEFELVTVPEGDDPRVDLVREVGFQKKLDFLKAMGRLSAPDVTKIKEFGRARNLLFHGGVFTNPHPMTIADSEEQRMMNLAGMASRIVTNRAFGVWTQRETDDLTNENIPQPEKPAGVLRIQRLKKELGERDRKSK
ncbi:MAG: hypothetical protein JRM91_04775 [Nitrososphaerota archaeon]|nr:hypothetical protein [Nitrososphaerota archaeon]